MYQRQITWYPDVKHQFSKTVRNDYIYYTIRQQICNPLTFKSPSRDYDRKYVTFADICSTNYIQR
jgi:hypothetical protein